MHLLGYFFLHEACPIPSCSNISNSSEWYLSLSRHAKCFCQLGSFSASIGNSLQFYFNAEWSLILLLLHVVKFTFCSFISVAIKQSLGVLSFVYFIMRLSKDLCFCTIIKALSSCCVFMILFDFCISLQFVKTTIQFCKMVAFIACMTQHPFFLTSLICVVITSTLIANNSLIFVYLSMLSLCLAVHFKLDVLLFFYGLLMLYLGCRVFTTSASTYYLQNQVHFFKFSWLYIITQAYNNVLTWHMVSYLAWLNI